MVLKSALRGAAVAASASVGLLVTPELAGSSNFESLPGFVPNPDAFCVGTGRADSKTHTFYYENVEPVMVTALNAHRSYMDGSAQVAVKTQLLASGNSATVFQGMARGQRWLHHRAPPVHSNQWRR